MVPGLCHGARELKPLGRGCAILRGPRIPDRDPHQKTYVYIATPDFERCFTPFIHSPCTCNELAAARNRVLADMPQPSHEAIRRLTRLARRLSKYLPEIVPEPLGQFAMKYSGAKRKRYLEAARQVAEVGIHKHMSSLKMFVKSEKMNPTKVNPDPRPIQFRDARYCVAVASFLKPLEHALYELRGPLEFGLTGLRIIGKGLNQVERAQLLQRKCRRIDDSVVVSLDCSRFDMHVSAELLQVEHTFYNSRSGDPLLAKLLSWQLTNTVFTSNGMKYRAHGRRMSGDMNTALGNCILMCLMVIDYCSFFGIRQYDILDDGDDCLLIISRCWLNRVVQTLHDHFLTYGHEVRIEQIATAPQFVSWCQSSPIEFLPHQWKFVRDPFKTMSCDLIGAKWAASIQARRRLLSSIGFCELVLNLGVPVLQEYALALIRASEGCSILTKGDFYGSSLAIRAMRELRIFNAKHLDDIKPYAITQTARISFARAFDVPVDTQIHMEEALRKWTIKLEGDVWTGPGLDPSTWVDYRSHPERYL